MADTTKLTIELEVILRRLNQTLRGLSQVEQRLRRIASIQVGPTQTGNTNRAAVAAQRLQLAQQRLTIQQQRLNQQQQQLAVGAQRLATAQGRAALAAQQLTRAQQRFTTGAATQNRILQQTQQRLNSLGAASLRVGGGLRSLGASASIIVSGPLLALGTIAARSAADIDAIRNRLIATEGSLEAANARLAQLRQLADQSIGVTRRTATDTFAILATLGEITEQTINDQIRAFGRLNAAFTIDDQQLFFRNLLQIFQQGFEVKDIKEALGRVPIFNQLLEAAFGTADPEALRDLKAAGKLTLDTFLAGLANAVQTDPVLGRISESIRVRFAKTIERIQDSLEPLGLAILGPLERIVVAVEPIILRIAAAFSRLPEGMQTAIVVVGILTAALGPVLFILGGIASGVGAIATALAALLPVLGSIGLPAIAVLLAGMVIVIGEVTAVITALGLAWQKNFLNIRGLVSDAATAVITAFNRIRGVFQEATQRILPTLQSIVTKVLGVITAVWERYGVTVVRIVGDAFRFITDVTVVFLRLFTDFVDLVLKLIDGDWRGAWTAFARIMVTLLDEAGELFVRFVNGVRRAMLTLTAFIIRQAIVFAQAGAKLAANLLLALATRIIAGAPQISNALAIMLLIAAAGVAVGPIAEVLAARLLAALRREAARTIPGSGESSIPTREEDVAGAGIFRRKRRTAPATVATEDEKTKNILRRQLDRMREAQDKLDEARAEAGINELRARIEREFDATKAGLDREERALNDSFEDRLASIKTYLAERARLEDAQVDAEIQKESELTSVLFQELTARRKAADREFQTELKEIAEDPKLKGEARQAAIITAQLKQAADIEKAVSEIRIKRADSDARVSELQKQQRQNAEVRLRFERLLTEEIAKQQVQIGADVFEAQGRTADAEAIRLKAQFTETLRDLRIDTKSLGVELQTALNDVDLTVLQQRLNDLPEPVRLLIELLDIGIKKAQITEAQTLVDALSVQLKTEEDRIQNRVVDGVINQRKAQEEIVALQLKYKLLLLDILAGEKQRAEEIGDQQLIADIEGQIADVERLGRFIDEIGQSINQQFVSDLQSGLSNIFSSARQGFEGLRDAAISFGERLLDTLNDIAASSIVRQLEDFFRPDAEDTRGTVGGFISKLFGLQPKQAADAATASATLQTGATTAAATFSTGVTTSGASFTASVVTAATSFASLIISAGAAFAAAVGIGGGAQAIGGLGSLLGGAATGMYPAVPGGVYKFVEGGHPEAVLTTDPKHAASQVRILRAFLRETRGLGGRIKSFAMGGFANPAEMMMSGMSGVSLPSSDVGSLAVAGAPSMMRLRQVLVDERSLSNWVNSSEGEQVMVDFLYKHQPIIRKIGGQR